MWAMLIIVIIIIIFSSLLFPYSFFAYILWFLVYCFYGSPKCVNERITVSHAFTWTLLPFCFVLLWWVSLGFIISYPYHIISYHINHIYLYTIPYHTMPCHTIPCHTMLNLCNQELYEMTTHLNPASRILLPLSWGSSHLFSSIFLPSSSHLPCSERSQMSRHKSYMARNWGLLKIARASFQ